MAARISEGAKQMFWNLFKRSESTKPFFVDESKVLAAIIISHAATRFHDVMAVAVLNALPSEQAANVKAELRDNIAKAGSMTVPAVIPAEFAQSYRDMVSGMMQVVLASNPDPEDLARGIDTDWIRHLENQIRGGS
jgi:hypothetical protein